jgi:predicted metalloprotease with PDZ domain
MRPARLLRLHRSLRLPGLERLVGLVRLVWLVVGLLGLAAPSVPAAVSADDAEPIEYRFSFPEAAQHAMDVDVTFPDLSAAPLQLRFSRSSPGRYSLHDFAASVDRVTVTTDDGRELAAEHPQPNEWNLTAHPAVVHVHYRVSANKIDGTYAAIDVTHAHLNMPAVVLWAVGLEHRAVRIRFAPRSDGPAWQAATQLFPTDDPMLFTAPNLQYLMDSPAEVGPIVWRTFEAAVPADASSTPPTIRIALHYTGTDAEADAFADGARRLVEEARQVFGEFPAYERNTYTFLADYLPSAANDGMEHRNSSVLTSSATLATARTTLLDTLAHEFFHCWNVERIRPRSLEPFDFERTNASGELWFAEGVTSYYDGLLMTRAGLWTLDDLLRDLGAAVSKVATSPATKSRSAEGMSRLAPEVDSASGSAAAATNTAYISYYTFGAALGLGFDFAIREHTHGRASLDDVMRTLWREFGRPGGREVGYVDRPYTVADLRRVLAEVTGNAKLADTLIDRYVEGHQVMDYKRLVKRAGLVVRQRPSDGRSEGPALEIVTLETAGRAPSTGQLSFRNLWLR